MLAAPGLGAPDSSWEEVRSSDDREDRDADACRQHPEDRLGGWARSAPAAAGRARRL